MRCLPTTLRPLTHACLLRWQRCRLLACPPSGSVIRCCRLCREAPEATLAATRSSGNRREPAHWGTVHWSHMAPSPARSCRCGGPETLTTGKTRGTHTSRALIHPAHAGGTGDVYLSCRGTRRGRSPCSIVVERRLATCVKPLVRAELVPSRLETWWSPQGADGTWCTGKDRLPAVRSGAGRQISADALPPPRSAGRVAALSDPEGAQEERCDDSIMN